MASEMDFSRNNTMKSIRVLALTRYGSLGASSRMRTFQYLPMLADAGFDVTTRALFDDAALSTRYKNGRYGLGTVLKRYCLRLSALWSRRHFDLVWIEKETLPWWPLWLEKLLLKGAPYVLDYDDALFHKYDQHRLAIVRRLFGKRIDGLMADAALVVCGNDYLAKRARAAGALDVQVIPTVIDLKRYPFPDSANQNFNKDLPVVVWIGSPSTVPYLQLLQAPLQELARRVPFVLRIIGGQLAMDGVQVECLNWSEDTEAENLASADVGVMPLLDTPWEQGKCAYKLIQYMACGLPVVASPVGANCSVVHEGLNGYLAADPSAWVEHLERLLTSTDRRKAMGNKGRQLVEQSYCIQVTGNRLAGFLRGCTNQSKSW
jgi:glycosyltransferase involved in cell wall biosynthesis